MKTRYRSTVIEVNLKNLYENYKSVSKIVGSKKVIPVVKADAYGHGAIDVVRYLLKNGVDHFAVSLLEEAIELREVFPDIKILCMGVIENDGLLIAIENNITVTMSNFDQLEYVQNLSESLIYQNRSISILESEYSGKLIQSKKEDISEQNSSLRSRLVNKRKSLKPLTVHMKIDTGMNRLGFKSDDDIQTAYFEMINNPMLVLEGIYTHFSTADNNVEYYDFQLERFKQVLNMLDHPFEMVHVSNSSSQIKFEGKLDFTTHTRLGISLYGLTLDHDTDFLLNTFSLKTKISQIKQLVKGEKVGYGAAYTASENELIGILPLGYADGFIRANTGGDVEINGKRYPIIGRICMDQMFIRIDDSISKQDDVILFGGLISIDEVAKRLHTINYEIICNVTKRVPREYIK